MAQQELPEIKLDADNLYRETLVTDRRAGSLRIMTPIKSDGSDDDSRPELYLGQAQLLTPMGPLPLSFEIAADSLSAALDKFPDAAAKAVEDAIEELKEMRREAASQIVIPEAGGGMGGMGGMGGPGGMSGGGGIQMP